LGKNGNANFASSVMTIRSKAHLAVLTANFIFAVNFSTMKLLTAGFIPAFALNLVRVGVSVPLFWVLYLLNPGKAGKPGFDRRDAKRFVLCAIAGVALNQLLFVKGLSLTLSIHGALLILATPIFITAMAAWLLHEAFTWNKAVGLAMGIGGAILLVLARSGSGSGHAPNMILGDVFIIANAISYAFYFVWVRPLINHYTPVHVLRWVFTIGAFFILPFGLPGLLETDFSVFTHLAWISLAFVVLGATFLAYLFNIYALKTLGPGIVGSYIYTQPVFATVIGVIFLHEALTFAHMLSAALIATGVFVVNMKLPAKQSEAENPT
jgi:drug/metabolite transporter (DMT)-like permease